MENISFIFKIEPLTCHNNLFLKNKNFNYFTLMDKYQYLKAKVEQLEHETQQSETIDESVAQLHRKRPRKLFGKDAKPFGKNPYRHLSKRNGQSS